MILDGRSVRLLHLYLQSWKSWVEMVLMLITTCFDSFRHLEFSPSAPHIARIYNLLSDSISVTANFRGQLELEAAWDWHQETKLSYFLRDFDWL